MKLRPRLLAVLAVFVALSTIVATGAFSSATAERTVDVNVAGDASALLAMEPDAASPNGVGGYASTTSDGRIQINFDGVSASGVNLDARTVLNHVFNVTNQGTQTVDLWITKSGSNTTAVTFYSGTVGSGTAIPTSQSSTITLAPGDSIRVSIEIDTRGSSNAGGDQLISSITLHAEA